MTKDNPNHLGIVRFKLIKTTPGALRYVEVNENGQEITTDDEGAAVGTLYLRKRKLSGKEPKFITMDMDEA